MRSTKLIRAAKLGYIILSIITCLMGAVMLTQPDVTVGVIARAVGAMMVAFGVIKLMGYYSRDLYRLAFQHDLALGILTLSVGCLALLRPGWAMNLLCLALGLEIITEGLFRIQTALDARRFGLETWWLIMALAVVAGGVGVALIVSPAEGGLMLTQLLGASLIAEGILNLCVALCAVKIVAHQQPDLNY
ncbi:MAG: DUF308 domain-containing protein [Clostridia bacterium]|nr:DUF308 domain-containing protein [Clostridia bacterium]